MNKLFASFAAAAFLSGIVSSPVTAQARNDQERAREEMRAGRVMSSQEIERRVIPQVKGEYLGFEYNGIASVYRLKFIRDGQVIWIDVDARTARVMRVSK